MPRAARILGNDITYHVVANCNAREFLFTKDSDFRAFLDHLIKCRYKFFFDLHAYSFLHSHIHLILTTRKDFFLDKVMYEICQRSAFRYNKGHSREGHFWKNRYFSKVISNDIYGIVCLRYLHINPLEANIVTHPLEWPWSCAKNYLTGIFPDWLTPLPSYLGLADKEETRKIIYRNWLETPLLSKEMERKLIHSKLRPGSGRFERCVRLKMEPILAEIRYRM